MTEKQKKFCIEYLKDLNATQAAIRAGYSEDSAKQIASENLSKHDIRDYIDKQLQSVLNDTKKSLETKILEELKSLAFDPMINEESSLRYTDKIKSLELLGKYTAMFTDKIEHTTINDEGESTGFNFVEAPKRK